MTPAGGAPGPATVDEDDHCLEPFPANDHYDAEKSALLQRLLSYNPSCDTELISRAFDYAAAAHGATCRQSGELYFYHPIAVAGFLADFRLDDASIATALLHDVVEDTTVTYNDIDAQFGTEIADLVEGVTKLSEIEARESFVDSREDQQAENFRKLILAIADDARVLLVKLADRIHNMRTLGPLRPEKRLRIAQETMEVYAPLAGRMGMQETREELEDLAFRILNPGARVSVLRRLVVLRRKHGKTIIPDIERDILKILGVVGIGVEVEGRQKRPYSIWRKMERNKVGFESLSDVVGFRVIVESVDAVYRAVGAMHQQWRAVPGRFKDYISNPKTNGYNSIHTTLIATSGLRAELQIRTQEMHDAAERGVAAHYIYRDGELSTNKYSVEPTFWLRDVLRRLEEGAPPTEFLEHVKLEMYHDQVFCFTPAGDVKRLPRGATVLDFAYAIHTNVGSSCVGARVDGHQAPYWKELRNGQTVEILRSDGQQPSSDWEAMVATGKAKSAIRRAVRDLHRQEASRFGKQLVERAFLRAGYDLTEDDLQRAVAALQVDDIEDLYRAVGSSEIVAADVLVAAGPNREASDEIAQREEPAVFLRGAQKSPVHSFCPFCNPIPFERIIGIIDPKVGGVTVHKIDCDLLEEGDDVLEDEEPWLDMFWGEHADSVPRYVSRIEVIIGNETGALGAVCSTIGSGGANICDILIVDRKPSHYHVEIDVEVRDAKHLYQILKSLDRQSWVDRIGRISGKPQPSAAD